MTTIKCFMLEPTDRAQESLRRFTGLHAPATSCPLMPGEYGYHNASVVIGEAPWTRTDVIGTGADDYDHGSPLWPARCGCGHVFGPDDEWQHNTHQLYRRSDTGDLVTLHKPPVGAMWFAPWYLPTYAGPDGRCLFVQTPGGEWSPDQPSTDGRPWTRSGEAPLFTAHPSIHIVGRYHGWLRNGELVEA